MAAPDTGGCIYSGCLAAGAFMLALPINNSDNSMLSLSSWTTPDEAGTIDKGTESSTVISA
jgi:hypothetical protein